jgi:hypothetical protein
MTTWWLGVEALAHTACLGLKIIQIQSGQIQKSLNVTETKAPGLQSKVKI